MYNSIQIQNVSCRTDGYVIDSQFKMHLFPNYTNL